MSDAERRRPRRTLRSVAASTMIAWAVVTIGATALAGHRSAEPSDIALAASEEPLLPTSFGAPAQTSPKPKATVLPQAPAPVATYAAPAPAPSVAAAPAQPASTDIPSVRVAVSTSIYTSQEQIDRCIGPVLFSWEVPVIAEHDYCGGWAHLGQHAIGDQVRVVGAGSADGVWKVTHVTHVPKGTTAEVLVRVGDLVFQTCLSNTSLKLTGLTRVS